MPRLAIIVPGIGSIQALESTLVSLLANRPDDCELLVVLNQPYADPYQLSGEVRFIDATPGAGAVACANLGMQSTEAPIVHLLAVGCEASEGWADAALRRFDEPRVAAVAPLVLDAGNRERVLAAGLSYSRGGSRRLTCKSKKKSQRLTDTLGACGFAAFYRKQAVEVMGGLSPAVGDRCADVDLALALRRAGFKAVVEPTSEVYAARDIDAREGAFRGALHAERLFWRNAPQLGWATSLAMHPWVVAMSLLASVPTGKIFAALAGRMIACCQVGHYPRRHQAVIKRAETAQQMLARRGGNEHVRIDRSHATTQRGQEQSSRRKAS